MAITPDGLRAISGSWDNTLKVWDLQTGRALATFTAEASIAAWAIAPDGRIILTGDALGRMHFLRLVE